MPAGSVKFSSLTLRSAHRSGQELSDADAVSQLPVISSCENEESVKMWEGTEKLMPIGGKYIPATLVRKLLELYHDSPESGGHDGFGRTYYKLRRLIWPGMKDIGYYIISCHECQIKAKYKLKTDTMIFTLHPKVPFEAVHIDFAELKKKSEGVKKTQFFLVCIDECSGIVAVKQGRENAQKEEAMHRLKA